MNLLQTEFSPDCEGAVKIRKIARLLFSFLILLAGNAASVYGQSALDGFDPNANGIIRAVALQPDGKILIGGDFTSLAPNGGATVACDFLARLNPDGTLDTAFNPSASGEVDAIVVQADGKILVGGGFTSIGGQARTFLARLDATTGAADSFNPSPNSDVLAIAVQADGKIIVGGDFNEGNGTPTIGGATRNSIARLDPTTGAADSFDPNANSTVDVIVVQANGGVLFGGNFSSLAPNGGATIARYDIARVTSAGLADSFAPNANGIVYAIAIQADGKILVGGNFSGTGGIGGQTRNHIARLDPVTGLPDSFNPNPNQQITALAIQPDGKILAGGNFAGANSIGGQTRRCIARLDPITGLADAFDPEASFPVLAIAVQQDGKILVAGQLTSVSADGETAVTRNHIARLETDGRPDQTLNLNIDSKVFAIAMQPDGKILIGGSFSKVLGVTRNFIARLNTDGTLDTSFDPEPDSDVYCIAVQPDGEILAGGDFDIIGNQFRNFIARLDPATGLADSFDPNADGDVFSIAMQADRNVLIGGEFTSLAPNGGAAVTRNFIARLNVDGTLDTIFNPNANDEVDAIAVQADGKVLAGGFFNIIGGQTRNYLARLDATNGTADSFNPNPNNTVATVALQPDGKILAGGLFTIAGGTTRNHIARLNTDGMLDTAFNPNANGEVFSTTLQADGRILAGGDFSQAHGTQGSPTIGGAMRNFLARVNATNGLADSFNPNADHDVSGIALQADGKILAGGAFTNINSQTRDYFGRLGNDTAALQSLTVTQTGITWTFGGASPQLTRVTFESSTDNVNFSPLGNGTSFYGGGWSLTGLNLPTGRNIYIRARGYYSTGIDNGSESIMQSVLNVFLPSVRLNIQLNANTKVVLSWPTNFTGFTLETSTNLAANTWSIVSPASIVSGTNNVVTNSISGSARFYRLSQ